MRRLYPYAAATLCSVFYLYTHAGANQPLLDLAVEANLTATAGGTFAIEPTSAVETAAEATSPRVESLCFDIDPAFAVPETQLESTSLLADIETPPVPTPDLTAKIRAAKVSFKPIPKADILTRQVAIG